MSRGSVNFDIYVGPVNNWKSLGIAVTKQAITDWHKSVGKKSKQAVELYQSCIEFFESSVCEWYSGLDGKTLLRKLNDGIL